MGWILGAVGTETDRPDVAVLSKLHPEPLLCISNSDCYVAAGGPRETCLFDGQSRTIGWIAVGLGLHSRGSRRHPLTHADWRTLFDVEEPPLRGVDGHFAALRWSGDRFEFFTDQLGLRSLYLCHVDGTLMFSTRLDWLACATGRREIDVSALGSHWLCFNQIKPRSLVKGIDRLSQGGRASFDRSKYAASNTPWMPAPDADTNFMSVLRDLISVKPPEGNLLSLGLSGGMDSRLLVALLLGQEAPFALHVFGDEGDLDVDVSMRIARSLDLDQRRLPTPKYTLDEAVRRLAEYASQTCASTPAVAGLKLGSYGALAEDGKVMIDGGFGEIARAQFMNRLRRGGRGVLRRQDAAAAFVYLKSARANIFNRDVLDQMRSAVEEELADVMGEMPAELVRSTDNYLDLLAIRTRLPNFYGYGQAWIDNQVMNFMPFAQPTFLSAVLAASSGQRRSGQIFRDAIRRSAPALATFPLVKSGTTYPFRFSTVPAWVWTNFKAKLGKAAIDRSRHDYLQMLRSYVQDLAASHETSSCALYDRDRLRTLVQSYYVAGRSDAEVAAELDWWLSFELWRRSLG